MPGNPNLPITVWIYTELCTEMKGTHIISFPECYDKICLFPPTLSFRNGYWNWVFDGRIIAPFDLIMYP